MYVALLAALVVLLSSVPSIADSHPVVITTASRSASAPYRFSPKVIENGSDTVTLPFQPQLNARASSNVAFGPDGTGYFIDASDAVAEVSPSGQFSSIAVSQAVGSGQSSIIYARANLWVTAAHGIVKVDPAGGARRLYNLALPGAKSQTVGVAYGNDGNVYALVIDYGASGGVSTWLYQIDIRGAVTGKQLAVDLPQSGNPAFISGANGDFYASYDDYYGSGLQGIAKIRFDGTVALYPTGSGFSSGTYAPLSLNFSNGNVYFITSSVAYVHDEDVYTWYLKRLNVAGIATLKTFAANEVADSLSIDFGRNIWITTSVAPAGPSLYQYNVSTGAFTGPYLNVVNAFGAIAVGSDDNVWLPMQSLVMVGPTSYCCYFSGFTVLVRHVQTLEPAAVTVSPAGAAQFTILETHSSGPWTALSQEPSIATVAPTVSATGVFTVSEVHPGSARILVKDRLGNFSYETVTAR